MPKPLVYVETTIASFYHELRTAPDIVARREWTRLWWSAARDRYDLVSSPAVLDELAGGASELGAERLALVRDLPLLPVEPAIADVVQAYVRHRAMPADPAGDALHLALASYHKSDFLVIWNCQHLANANKFGHIRRVNTVLGLFVPALVTPLHCSEAAMRRLLSDPVIDEVREVRHRISAQVDHDPVRLVAYYVKLQEQYRDRLIANPRSDNGAEQPAA